jgi:outer membrane protein assembly factor BamB
MQIRRAFSFLATTLFLASPCILQAADWPMWRYDANRSGATTHELPTKLYLQWMRDIQPLQPAWPDQDKMQFDIVREPIVVGQTMYLNTSRHDCVRALDTHTGLEKWRYFVDGPVRFAPIAWEDRIYFTSDDGYLYCLQGNTGKLVWKYRGGPSDRKIIGNLRLISTWPARGAPVIVDGKVYFAASIWPFMGIFIHAVDARTGQAIWTNDGDGSLYMTQPHHADSFGSIAPQGPLVVIGDKLLVPGGRSVPACFDRHTGKLLHYRLAENERRGGGSEVAAIHDLFFNGGAVFEVATGKYLSDYGKLVVLSSDIVFTHANGKCRVFDLKSQKVQEASSDDGKGKTRTVTRWTMPEIAAFKAGEADTMMKAGSRLYLGGTDSIAVFTWNADKKELTPGESLAVTGKVVRLIAADDRLFAVTRGGRIYCFAGQQTKPVVHVRERVPVPEPTPQVKAKADQIFAATKTRAGYVVVWGVGDGQLVEALTKQSAWHLIVVEADVKKVQHFRERWAKADLYGTRIALVPGDWQSVSLPPYVTAIMVCEDPDALGIDLAAPLPPTPLPQGARGEFLTKAYQTLRPFGGRMYLIASERTRKLAARFEALRLPGAKVAIAQDLIMLIRAGALPGSANWTHEHADASNTRVSKDALVKAPLGVLWFGGPSHEGILPRHGHGPQPQVIEGRMILEGVDVIRAIDIYCGRLLWEAKLPGVGAFYNNLAHQPGANASGSNFVSTSDGIYVAYDKVCVRLNPASGVKLSEFPLPTLAGMKEAPRWGYINVVGDYLIGGADPLIDPKSLPPEPKPGEKKESSIGKLFKTLRGWGDEMSSSRHLVVMDRHTGKVLWTASAKNGFRHNATCVGGGRLYTIDRLSGEQLANRKKGDKQPQFLPRLVAFDLQTGKELWSSDKEVFGTWLSYSQQHDVVVEAGRVARDSLFDEPKGMRAYRAKDGKDLWREKSYIGPAMIHGDTILQDQGGCDLLTGALKMRKDSLSGALTPWRWTRGHGCNTPSASEHLLTFRSGAAGYFDYSNDGGTGNFGGFRSSCTNNLIVAGGLLTAPEYTRTCTCAYQNQSSIALIHMPEAEMWTFSGSREVKGSIKRLGLNFGAPGDRKAEDGTLWLGYPSIGGASPAVQITTKPPMPEVFRRHSSSVTGPYNWVTSSGLKGVSEVTVTLGKMDQPTTYTVRLYFAEPDELAADKRVFHVYIQDKQVLSDFNIAKEAGGRARSLIKEFKGISAQGQVTVRLDPSATATVRAAVLCGLELIAEEK